MIVGQQVGQPEVHTGLGGEVIELRQHRSVVAPGGDVDREHAAGVADAEHLLAGQLPVDVAGQGGQVGDAVDMVLAVQDRLVEVRDAPPMRECCARTAALSRSAASPVLVLRQVRKGVSSSPSESKAR